MRFEGKNYIVTGGSSGIGFAVADRLVRAGAGVMIVARDEGRLAAAASVLGNIRTMVSDVSTEAGCKSVAEAAAAQFGTFHGVVHCAGSHRLVPLKVLSSDALAGMLASHVTSSVMLCKTLGFSRALAPGASFVLLSSAAALRGAPGAAAYAAAKAGLIAAARCVAAELAPRRTRVNTISPGVVVTPQSEAFLNGLSPDARAAVEKSHPLGLGRAEDVAGAALYLLSEDAAWVTGTNLVVDGGLTLS